MTASSDFKGRVTCAKRWVCRSRVLALRQSVFNARLFDLDQDTDCDGSVPRARRRSTMSDAGHSRRFGRVQTPPLYTYKQTSLPCVAMSQRCHFRTFDDIRSDASAETRDFLSKPFEGAGPRYTVERLVLHSVVVALD